MLAFQHLDGIGPAEWSRNSGDIDAENLAVAEVEARNVPADVSRLSMRWDTAKQEKMDVETLYIGIGSCGATYLRALNRSHSYGAFGGAWEAFSPESSPKDACLI